MPGLPWTIHNNSFQKATGSLPDGRIHPSTSHRISVDRNFYFHIDKKCINKFKRNFNGRVFIDKNMTVIAVCRADTKG